MSSPTYGSISPDLPPVRSTSPETSVLCKLNGVQYATHLVEGALQLRALPGFSGAVQEVEILLQNVLSAELVTRQESRRTLLPDFFSSSASSAYAVPLIPSLHLRLVKHLSPQKWRMKTDILELESVEFGEKLCRDIKDFIGGLQHRPKRLMFFVNPISGGGNAVKIMTRKISPLLATVGVQFDHLVTERAGHAKEWIMNQSDISATYDGLIAVGGDGIFNEILDGVISKAQEEKVTAKSLLNAPAVRVGIIPAGSTDSIGCCIGLGDPVTALIHILLGDRMMLDVGAVFRVEDGSLIKFFCAFLGYGFFSDTLRNSEKRWLRRYLGKTRYMLAGAKTFFLNRAYPGYISYRAAEDGPAGYPDEGVSCLKDCSVCTEVGAKKSSSSFFSFSSQDGVEEDWQTLDGRFTNVIAVSLCCRSEKSPKGLAPTSHCGDGCLDLLVVKSLGRFRLLHYLISTSRGIGPRSVLGDRLHACRAYELVFRREKPAESGGGDSAPVPPPPPPSTVWNCDGEIIFEADIHVKIYCQLIDIFGAGLEPS